MLIPYPDTSINGDPNVAFSELVGRNCPKLKRDVYAKLSTFSLLRVNARELPTE